MRWEKHDCVEWITKPYHTGVKLNRKAVTQALHLAQHAQASNLKPPNLLSFAKKRLGEVKWKSMKIPQP